MRPNTVSGYVEAPALAWSGWRLRIPGGPEGGQYHGYIASDDVVDGVGWPAGHDETFRPAPPDDFAGLGGSPETNSDFGHAEGWERDWGGTALLEGETVSDHVYRSPGEVRPRANASGGVNVVQGFQTRKTAGYAVAPGNYRHIGALPALRSALPVSAIYPNQLRPCPAWGCGGPGTRILLPGSGATSVVNQPPPPQTLAPSPSVPVYYAPPVSPSPAPTVAYNDPQCLAAGMNGGPFPNCNAGGLSSIDSMTPATSAAGAAPSAASASLSDWLSQSSVIAGIPNMYVAGAAALAAFLLLKGKK